MQWAMFLVFSFKDAVDAVLDNGFRISHANLDVRHNRYGVGNWAVTVLS